MRIIFAGDLFCGGDLLNETASSELIQIPEFFKADFRIVNLEGPFSDQNEGTDKCRLYAPNDGIKYLRAFHINGVNLANNHVHDKGNDGIINTIDTLDKYSIKHCGAGENIKKSRSPLILEKDGEKVAILGYCDYDRPYLKEVQIAGETTPGVAPLRYEIILEDLDRLDDSINQAVLFFHWGREHTWFPSKEEMRLAMKVLDHPKVAVVVGSHSHLPQGFIRHRGKKAFMSLGNFLFPNCYIVNAQIAYPLKTFDCDIMHGYHSVSRLTHKRWSKWFRRSILVSADITRKKCDVIFSEQEYLRPIVRGIKPFVRFYILSRIYSESSIIYDIISEIWYSYIQIKHDLVDYYLYLRYNGIKKGLTKLYLRMIKRYKKMG